MRKFLTTLVALVGLVSGAIALTPAQDTVLFQSRNSSPVASANFVTNPVFPSAILSHSRTSLATMFDSTGKLTYAPNNLLTYSNTFSNAAWTKVTMTVASGFTDPLGGSNATRLTATGATSYVLQSTTSSSGFNALTSIWVRRVSGSGTINLWTIGGSTGTAITPTSTWTQYSATGNAPTGVAYAGIIIQTSGDVIEVYAATASAVTYETTPRSSDQVITTSAAYYGPRFDYTYNGGSWVPAGLLVEGSTTNELLQSSNLANAAWTNFGSGAAAPVPTANAAVAPDGTTTAASIAFPAVSVANTYSTTYQGKTAGSSAAYTGSIYLRGAVGGETVWIMSSPDGVTFASTACVLTTSWQRFSVSRVNTSGVTEYFHIGINLRDGAQSAKPAQTIYAWGGQRELGTSATSMIVTAASAVTRAAEVVQLTGTALAAVQGVQGAVVYEGNGSRGTSVMVGSGGSQYRPYISGTSFSAYDGTTALSAAGSVPTSSVWRGGVAWSAAGRSITLNGGAVASDANGTGTFTNAYLGNNNGSLWVNTHIRSVAFYNSRLPDATLQAKSVVGASYAANDNVNPFAPQFAANNNLPLHWRIVL